MTESTTGTSATSNGKPKLEEAQSTADILVGFVTMSILFTIIIGVALFFLIGSIQSPSKVGLFVVLPYYTYTMFLRRDELKDGNHWHHFSQNFFVLNIFRRYLRLEIQKPIPPQVLALDSQDKAQVLLAVFPHGSNSDYRVAMDGILHEALPILAEKVRTLTASSLFRVPLAREIALWTGCVDASRKVAERQFDQGRSILVLPGGEQEQIRTQNGRELVYVDKRKGFIKLALRKNVPVVPVYVFGASDLYHTSNAAFGLRLALVKNLGVAIPLTAGKCGFPLCPVNVKTTIVFGTPIEMKCKEPGKPTDEEVQAKHKEFVMALEKLFDDNKTALGYGDRKLDIM
ncbi:Diacylglycerol O-acyltransferase 2 [Seminavis robusta]|uniref:Acyltransferase n=1 Tax=Seminavis robusta TaxID=568900 RepID=A0A9N8DX27_9STRA|nr:Diacylglycerol O-acyltransferase 2 [Seminavis robusta]|eukprot:Sro441_g143620.1 Diacylglycerol O-acyltransferase 2 (344) ;mRNA; f:12962-13993